MNKRLLILFSFLSFLNFVVAQNATINFEVIDQNTKQYLPAKLVLLQEGQPFEHKLAFTDDLACRGHTIYSRTGKGSFQLPAGKYEIWFGRGMEYSVDVQEVVFDRGERVTLKASLKRELNPEGFVGGDMHLHTYTFSGHGDATVEERLISCVAEGLEWAVATDHNTVLDYQPYLEKLGLGQYMATAVGNEVSTPIGHFNTYPLANNSEKVNSKITVGKELYETIRKEGLPETVIQINHPRWVASDFFNTKGLDPFYGISKHPEWDWDFDAFEVLNENFGIGWRDAPDNKFSVKQDWFNMLNRGIKKTGLGNSDSHSVIAQIAGVPRNYIKSSTETPKEISNQELAESIKNQQVSVARGLFVNMETAEGQGIGSTVVLDGNQQKLTLNLFINAPSWVTCNKAELVENGVVIQTFEIPKTSNPKRFERTITLNPTKDSWYLFIAYGDEPMAPMVQGLEKPVLPLGFTNPIWVDADGNEEFTSLYDQSKQLIETAEGKIEPILTAMKTDPAIVYPTLYHLFESYPAIVNSIMYEFLQVADTRQKQLIYRELSKLEAETAKNILKGQKRAFLNPLEEVVLNYYTEFPLYESKMERFKKTEATDLDEQLNYLEDKYRFQYSGATEQWFKIARSNGIATANQIDWTEAIVPNDGVFPIGKLLNKQPGKYFYIHYPIFARMDTSVTFYINTNTNLRVNRGARILQSVSATDRFPIRGKLVKVKVQKGENDLIFRLDARDKATISLEPINPNKLLDDDLKTVKTVSHLALDKPVKYLIAYAPKYHGHGVALTDGFRGTTDFSSQLWQGWNGENAELVIDLEAIKTINLISVGTLIDQKSWIFSPASIQCSFSTDGVNFSNTQTKEIESVVQREEAAIEDISIPVNGVKARYIKIVAQKIPSLSDWHAGKGGAAWIVLDEVVVE